MFNENVMMVDIDAEHWVNFTRLLSGELLPRPEGRKEKQGRATLRLMVKEGRCVKAIHSEKGILLGYQPPSLDPAAVARQEGVSRVAILEHGLPRRVMHRVQSRLSLDQNYAEQGLTIYEAIREEVGVGLKVYPPLKLPKLKYSWVAFGLKRFLPPGHLFLFVVYADEGQFRDSSGLPIVTSGLFRLNEKAELDLWTTTDSLVSRGLVSLSNWREDYRLINALAERTWHSRLFLAGHLPVSVLPRLQAAAQKRNLAATLLRLHEARELILEPFPLRLRGLLKIGGRFKV
ncbi:MAG: hypothetical protein ABIN58_10195 [candidate division WOR-3 bacterium]